MKKILASILCLMVLSACSEVELGSHLAKNLSFPSDPEKTVGDFKVGSPYKVKGRTYTPKETYQYSEVGTASWYGPGFHGKLTANGEIFNKYELTAAHKTLQLPSIIRVTNLENGRSIIVRVNDRGPFSQNRILDLSERAAEILDMKHKGTAKVRIDVLEKESRQVAAAARNGLSTRGTEIVLNRGNSIDDKMPLVVAKPTSKPSISGTRLAALQQKQQSLSSYNGYAAAQKPRFGDMLISQANASEFRHIQRKPVISPAQDIYVHAGQFANIDNAMTYKMSLGNSLGPVAIQNNGTAYDVKIGPFISQEAAQNVIAQLNRRNRQGRIVIVQK